MCGRFTLTKNKKDILEEYQKRFNRVLQDVSNKTMTENYNIAPSQEVAVIYQKENQVYFDYHQWGLVPYWSKDTNISGKLINARKETIDKKPTFKDAFFSTRCLIIADGYYEWAKKGKEKIPYYFILGGHKLFAFAGIRVVRSKANNIISSCSIITTEATNKVNQIHDRMPVILNPQNELEWLDPDLQNKSELFKILDNNYNHNLDYYQVSKNVNNASNNYRDLINPVSTQLSLF